LELQRSRDLIARAWSDPNLRPGLKAHVKAVMPDYRLPDDDFEVLTAPIRQQNEALAKQVGDLVETLKKRDEDAAKRDQEHRDAQYAERFEAACQRFNLTDEGRQKVIDRMKETGAYGDPLAAAAYIVSQEPPAAPTGALWGNNTLNFAASAEKSDTERYKLLHSGLDGPGKYLEAEIRDAFGPNSKEYVAREMGKMYADLAYAQ
jgi:hypothetical protein